MSTSQPGTIDEYIAGFPEAVQQLLEQVRATVRKAAPKAEEAIKYGIPTLVQNGNLISFAGYKKHIGLYPAPVGVSAFEQAIAPYLTSKATLQFPLDKPLPLTLIADIVTYRAKHLAQKAEGKKTAK